MVMFAWWWIQMVDEMLRNGECRMVVTHRITNVA